MFLEEAKLCRDRIETIIRKGIDAQRLFDGRASREYLCGASTDGIKRYRLKWEQGRNVASVKEVVRTRIIRLLEQLEFDKMVLENLEKMQAPLASKPLKLSVFELLEVMFQLISGCLGRHMNTAG